MEQGLATVAVASSMIESDDRDEVIFLSPTSISTSHN